MLKKIFSFVICVTMLMCVTVCTAAAEDGNPFYLALGDSITSGYTTAENLTAEEIAEQNPSGLPDSQVQYYLNDKSFASIVADGNDMNLANKAVTGSKAPDVLEKLESGALDNDLKRADIITITCGGNDLMHAWLSYVAEIYNMMYDTNLDDYQIMAILQDSEDAQYDRIIGTAGIILGSEYWESSEFNTSVSDFISSLNECMAYIKGKNTDAMVIVTTQYNPYKDFSGMYEELLAQPMEKCALKLRTAVMDNADTGGYEILDLYSIFNTSAETLCNATEEPMQLDFHPNVMGHEVIAENLSKMIAPVLEARAASLADAAGSMLGYPNIWLLAGGIVIIVGGAVAAVVIIRRKQL